MVTFTHVFCPVDFSETSLRALDHAVSLAGRFKARLTLLHVAPTFEPITTRTGVIGEDVRFVQTPAREEVIAEIERLAREAGAGAADLTAAAEAGDTVSTILDQRWHGRRTSW